MSNPTEYVSAKTDAGLTSVRTLFARTSGTDTTQNCYHERVVEVKGIAFRIHVHPDIAYGSQSRAWVKHLPTGTTCAEVPGDEVLHLIASESDVIELYGGATGSRSNNWQRKNKRPFTEMDFDVFVDEFLAVMEVVTNG